MNTFNLTKVVSIGGAAFELDPATMIVTMTGGAIEWLADVQRSDGTGIRKDYSVTLYLTGKKINIGADPPVWVPTPMN